MARSRRRRERDRDFEPVDDIRSHALVHRPSPAIPPQWWRRREPLNSTVTSQVRRALRTARPGALITTRAAVSPNRNNRTGRTFQNVREAKMLERVRNDQFCRQSSQRDRPLPDQIRHKIARQMKARGAAGVPLVKPPLCR